tara:strand:+ start:1665 stop:2345 length:681 start_codon:yes stop_codon:yes gene_type:complete
MATSNTATFNLTVNDVIQEAFDRIGGDPILGYDVRSARRSLNIMFSDWANRGYNQWTVELKDISVSQGTTDYTLDYDTIDIINANILDDSTEFSMTRLGLNDYAAISNKTQQSRPTQFYLQRLNTPVVKIYPAPDKAYTLRYYRMRKIQDVTASTVNGVEQNLDIPFRAFECMCAGLAYYMSKKRVGIDQSVRAELKLDYEQAYERLIAGDDSPSTRILPSTSYYN